MGVPFLGVTLKFTATGLTRTVHVPIWHTSDDGPSIMDTSMSTRDDLETIPGVGPSIAEDLRELGIRRVADHDDRLALIVRGLKSSDSYPLI